MQTMNNFNTFVDKSQVLSNLLTELSQNSEKTSVVETYLKFADRITFIPISLTVENGKVSKKPLVKWKNLDRDEAKKWLKRLDDGLGVAVRVEDLDVVVLDIDDIERFQAFVGKDIQSILEDLSKDACLITKSISRGYHIYLSGLVKDLLSKVEVNNRELLENYGFEVKKKDLILIPPSRVEEYECRFLFINPQNIGKETIESEVLNEIFIQVSYGEVERLNNERISTNGNGSGDLELVKEIKKRIKFKDLIGNRFDNEYTNYETYHCPFHPPDNTPSFVVYTNREYELGIDYHDHETYDVIKLYQRLHNTDFKTAIKELAKIAGISLPEKKRGRPRKSERKRNEVNEDLITLTKPVETERAFYTQAVKSDDKNERKIKFYRYACDRRLCKILGVEELVKREVDLSEYEKDKNSWDFILLDQFEYGTKHLYSYRAFHLRQVIAHLIIEGGEIIEDKLGLMPHIYNLRILTADPVLTERKLENKTLDELISWLRLNGYVGNKRIFEDALSYIIDSMLLTGKLVKKREIPYQGFFLNDEEGSGKKIICSKIEVKEIDEEKLRESLIFLDYICKNFYSPIMPTFSTILKWFIVAPFSFVVKQLGRHIKSLYLYGVGGTGKTKASVLCSYIWASFRKIEGEGSSGASMDTVPRLGNLVSKNTFPVIVNEPQGAFIKEDVKEALKNAITSTVVREKYLSSTQAIKIPALSNICFTSNYQLPNDEAILRRLHIINFSLQLKHRSASPSEFTRMLKEAEKKLPVIGEAIVYYLSEFEDDILTIDEENYLQVGEKILRRLYEKVGLDVPEWVGYVQETEATLDVVESEFRLRVSLILRNYLIKKASQIYMKRSGDNENKKNIREIVSELVRDNQIEFVIYQNNRVYITRKVIDVLSDEGLQLPNLKTFAELIQIGRYLKKSFRQGRSVMNVYVVEMNEDEFLDLLTFNVEEQQPDNSEPSNEPEYNKPNGGKPDEVLDELLDSFCNYPYVQVPEPEKPKPVESKPVEPKPVEPKSASPEKPDEDLDELLDSFCNYPYVRVPEPKKPKPVESKPAESKPVEPKPASPENVDNLKRMTRREGDRIILEWDGKREEVVDGELNGVKNLEDIEDIEIQIENEIKLPEVVVFDLETEGLDPKQNRILAVGIAKYENGEEKLLRILKNEDEAELLRETFRLIAKDGAIITGYNILDFDIPFLIERAKVNGVECPFEYVVNDEGVLREKVGGTKGVISSDDITFRKIKKRFNADIVDTLHLVAKYDFVKRELREYNLKYVAKEFGVAVEGRPVLSAEEIVKAYKENSKLFDEYLSADLRECYGVFSKLVLPYVGIAKITKLKLENVVVKSTAWVWEQILRREYVKDNWLPEADKKVEYQGGLVVSRKGLFKECMKLDIASLYPSIMLYYQIYSRKDYKRIALRYLKKLTELRLQYKAKAKEGDKNAQIIQESLKILINSLYGYYGTEGYSFNDMESASKVTEIGRKILTLMIHAVEEAGGIVVEADTDGILIGYKDEEHAERIFNAVQGVLPSGFKCEVEFKKACVFVDNKKNYIVVHEDGSLTIKGAKFRGRDKEAFWTVAIPEAIKLYSVEGSKRAIEFLDDVMKQIKEGRGWDWVVKVKKVGKNDKYLLNAGFKIGQVVQFAYKDKKVKTISLKPEDGYDRRYYTKEFEAFVNELKKILQNLKGGAGNEV